MVEIEQDYDFCKVEERWERRWAEEKPWQFDVQDVGARLAAPDQKKFYNLVEFPYPSGEGLHVGHVYTFSGADCYSRYRRMRGARVFQPMGFDSFGIHTENYALKVGEHPMQLTAKTIANYQRQLNRIGAIWNWEHQVVTSDPSYYKWTQWIFLQLFKAGLAVQKVAPVVWCPSCLTVLANEQLEGDRCERCDSIVEQREMKQWFFKITDYAEKLLAGLEEIDWPELSKNLQREWIGRSEATEIDFTIEDSEEKLTVFTTRPDTLFGATFVVLAPDHPQLPALIAGQPEASKIHAFAERLKARAANSESSTEQRGVFTGRRTINPANGKAIPIYLADYVVSGYGTGAVMAVPAHDSRDYDFAKLMNLPIVQVIESEEAQGDGAWIGEGQLVNSGDFTGMESAEARPKITRWLSETGRGRSAVYYRLRDWLISRQRYWGPPIPIIHCDRCGAVPVPEEDLPVLLPEVENFRPTGTGLSPLASVESFVQTTCPQCDAPARRETDVSDTFVDSAWYFLRYPSSDIQDRPWDPERTERLLP
ncbi:MAG: leucine--tRNA ligase, partial [Candidatus Dormibacteraceae bacterium]